MIGTTAITGDHNTVTATVSVQWQAALPAPESVDIAAELTRIRDILANLQQDHAAKTSRAMEDAQDEVRKAAPDKDEIGNALERAVKYAKTSITFANEAENLAPHLASAASWLGPTWHHLLSLVGFAPPL